MARLGLGVMREPLPALARDRLPVLGWIFQLLAVYAAMRGFDIHEPLAGGGARARADERRDDLPALAGQRRPRSRRRSRFRSCRTASRTRSGFAFGIGLQAIEASVGVGVGLFFLAREGLSFAMLRRMPEMTRSGARREAASGSGPRGEPRA